MGWNYWEILLEVLCSFIIMISYKGLYDLIGRIKGGKTKSEVATSTSHTSTKQVQLQSVKNTLINDISTVKSEHTTDTQQHTTNKQHNLIEAQLTNAASSEKIKEIDRTECTETIGNPHEKDNGPMPKKRNDLLVCDINGEAIKNSNEDRDIIIHNEAVDRLEKTTEIPSKLSFKEPNNTIYQFPEPNAQNESCPIGGILGSSDLNKKFDIEEVLPSSSTATTVPESAPSATKLLNASEVASNRPRSSLLFTRRQKHKKMDRGLETINRLILSVVGQSRGSCVIKSTPITDDYTIGNNVLGLGINGKVVECIQKIKETDKTNSEKPKPQKCALKVLKDNAKSRREIDLHWKASNCKHIVNILDVYENTYSGNKCLLVVMEW